MESDPSEWPCPTCGDPFDTENGMKVHHAKSHGESISGVLVTCDHCGDSARVERFRAESDGPVFCDGECFGRWKSENVVAEDHPRNSKVDVDCANCGEVVPTHPYRLENQDRIFCDHDCYGEWISENMVGENSVHWKGGKPEAVCATCGSETTQHYGDDEKLDHAFCDRECFMEWHSENMVGENSPRWKGGYSKNRGTDWPALRAQALAADDHQCQGCGRHDDDHRDEHGVGLHVHHIRPVTEFDEPSDADTVDNLVPLCRDCHTEWEGIPLRPTTD